jgi:hypothetical protein
MKKLVLLILVVCGLIACEREEGKGGTSTIKGKIITWEYNKDFTIKLGEYPSQDVNVFILYGDDEFHGEKVETGYDGKYEFNYLTEGKYTIYALSKDTNNLVTSEMIPVFREINISGKNTVVEVDDIIIVD